MQALTLLSQHASHQCFKVGNLPNWDDVQAVGGVRVVIHACKAHQPLPVGCAAIVIWVAKNAAPPVARACTQQYDLNTPAF